MAQRYAKSASVGQYLYKRYTASQGVTAIDANTHGHFLGYVTVGKLGTSLVVTLQNGTDVISAITPTQAQTFFFDVVCDAGLQVGLAGSGFDVTVTFLPQTV